jgi:hypothetical protein
MTGKDVVFDLNPRIKMKGEFMKLEKLLPLMIITAALGNMSFVVHADDTAAKSEEHAQNHPKNETSAKAPSPEMRQKMAEMHQMMSDCLKSDKPMSECKQEMMKNCPMMKEGGHCPMMGEMDEMMGHSKHSSKKATKVDEHKQH